MTAPKGRGLVLYLVVGAAALPGIAAVAAAQEAGPTVGGSAYEQAYAAYSNGSPPLPSSFSYGSITDLELALSAKGEKARAEATISAQMLTGTAAAIAWSTAAAGLARPDELMLPAYSAASPSMPETVFGARVRTLYVKLDEGAFSALAGRQVVNFGKGVLWSPVDIFDELDLSGLSPDRRGSDALRLSEALGETGSLDLVGAPTFDPAFGRYALRGTGLVGGANLGFLAAREGERLVGSRRRLQGRPRPELLRRRSLRASGLGWWQPARRRRRGLVLRSSRAEGRHRRPGASLSVSWDRVAMPRPIAVDLEIIFSVFSR